MGNLFMKNVASWIQVNKKSLSDIYKKLNFGQPNTFLVTYCSDLSAGLNNT